MVKRAKKEEKIVLNWNSQLKDIYFDKPKNLDDNFINWCFDRKNDLLRTMKTPSDLNLSENRISEGVIITNRKSMEEIEAWLTDVLWSSLFNLEWDFEYVLKCIQHRTNYKPVFNGLELDYDVENFIKLYKKIINLLVRKLLKWNKERFLSLMNSNSQLNNGELNFIIQNLIENDLPSLLPDAWKDFYSDFIESEKEYIFKLLTDKTIQSNIYDTKEYLEILTLFFTWYLRKQNIGKRFDNYSKNKFGFKISKNHIGSTRKIAW